MSSECFIKTPPVNQPLTKPLVVAPADPHLTESLTPERARAADAVFAHYEEHHASLTDIFGFTAAVMLLGDLVQEATHKPDEEDEGADKEEEEAS
jgi:hypothetical protein